MKHYVPKKRKQFLEDVIIYSIFKEHDACGVGFVASTEGRKPRRDVVTIWNQVP